MHKTRQKKSKPENTKLENIIAKLSRSKSQPSLTTANKNTRKVELAGYKHFKLQKKIKSDKQKPPTSWQLFKNSIKTFRANWRVLLGLAVLYQLLVTVLVRNFSVSVGLPELRDEIETAADGVGSIFTGFVLVATLIGSGTETVSEAGSLYQMILIVVFSLAFIWALRQITAKQPATVKSALYQGMYPLIPFTLVLLVVFIQLLPMTIGTYLYSIVISTGIAVNFVEHLVWIILTLLLSLLSLYMITSSIFGLYIVTLPNTKPLQALKAARDLVRHRRFMVLRKMIFLPLLLLLIGFGLMIPFVVFATVLSEWVFYTLTMIAFAITHTYFYNLYRKLIV